MGPPRVKTLPAFTDLVREHDLLLKWLLEKALPLWAHRGHDSDNGGFFEKIAHDGSVIDEPRRTRLVGRQIFVFATASTLGWKETAKARDLVNSGLDFLLDKCRSNSGPVYSTVSPSGHPLRKDFDLYDHAFALFGLGTAARLGHRRIEAFAAGRSILEAMMSGWKHRIAGFEESIPPREPLNANPHMHLLEAFLEWEDAGESSVWRRLSDEIAELALSRFVDPDTGAIREHYDRDWRPAPGQVGRIVEPGHQFEWAWLLWRWGTSRRHAVSAKVNRLVGIGEEYGVNHLTGLAINGMWDDLSLRDGNSRLWPQTERIKANIALAELGTGEVRRTAVERAANSARGLRRYFNTELEGLWYETIDAEGRPIPDPARASSLYHIVCAVRELGSFLSRSIHAK